MYSELLQHSREPVSSKYELGEAFPSLNPATSRGKLLGGKTQLLVENNCLLFMSPGSEWISSRVEPCEEQGARLRQRRAVHPAGVTHPALFQAACFPAGCPW